MQHQHHRTVVAVDVDLHAVDLAGARFTSRTLDCHSPRSKIFFMERPSLAAMSVPTDAAEFLHAELAAFVEVSKRDRPTAWRRVEQLQRVCRSESPATAAGPALAAKAFEPSERASSGVTTGSEARSSA